MRHTNFVDCLQNMFTLHCYGSKPGGRTPEDFSISPALAARLKDIDVYSLGEQLHRVGIPLKLLLADDTFWRLFEHLQQVIK